MKANIFRIALAAALTTSGLSAASELVLSDEILFALPGASFDPEDAPLVYAPADWTLAETAAAGSISGVEHAVNASVAIDFVEVEPGQIEMISEEMVAERSPSPLDAAVILPTVDQSAPSEAPSILRDAPAVDPAVVPEPGLSVLGLLGGMLLLLIRRRNFS